MGAHHSRVHTADHFVFPHFALVLYPATKWATSTMFSRPLRLSRAPFSALNPSVASSGFVHHSSSSPARGKDSIIQIPVEAKLPARAQVLIAGSGLIGNSVAYHLVENGWKDVVIIDRGHIADGTSKYGSGMLGMFRPAHERNIVQYCKKLYRKLQQMVSVKIEVDLMCSQRMSP